MERYNAMIAAACGLLLAGCGGSGGSAPEFLVGFGAAPASSAEGTSWTTTVVLEAAPGPLEAPLSVTLSATGSASAGQDHDFTADRVVTFAIGAEPGDALPVVVELTADGAIEGAAEELVLALSGQGAVGFTTAVQALEIVDGDFATLQFVPAADVLEGAMATLQVELSLDPGEVLATELGVTASDAGTGSATPGVDYTAFGPVELTFAAGSPDGARQAFEVQSVQDLLTEASETIVVQLDSTSPGGLVSVSSVALSLQDDDPGGEAFLLVEGFTGSAPSGQVLDGQAFALGSASVGAESSQVLQLRFENAGGQALELEPLTVVGDVEDFEVALLPVAESAALELPMLGAFPLAVEHDDALLGASLSLEPLAFAALGGATRATLFDVALPGGATTTLELERVELPLAPDAVIAIDGRPSSVAEVLGDLSIWKGVAAGMPGSEAFLAFSSEGSHGWLHLGESWGDLHLITERASGAPVVRWMWASQLEQNLESPLQPTCAGEAPLPGGATAAGLHAPDVAETSIGLGLPECRIAIETDYQLFQRFGSTPATSQYVTQLIAAVSEVYERDVQTKLTIAYLGLHSSANDGWTAQDQPGATPGDVLDEFRDAWGSNLPAPADLAHFISGANLGGGIAYVSVLCSQSFGFGVSANISGNIDWGGFSGQPSVANWDFVVVAHELGHNFGSPHTHGYCPPVDQCASNCTGPTGCEPGTIMSYCHLCGGMANIALEFHPTVAQRMRDRVATSCLGGATLLPGAELTLTVTFAPHETAGSRAAELQLQHDAPNESSPFVVAATGTATN